MRQSTLVKEIMGKVVVTCLQQKEIVSNIIDEEEWRLTCKSIQK
jgi:hypothetical protein